MHTPPINKTVDHIPVDQIRKSLRILALDNDLLRQAFVDKSAAKRSGDGRGNGWLSYIGDAAIELAVRRYLGFRHPELEPYFNVWRGAVTAQGMFAVIADRFGLEEHLIYDADEVLKFKQSKGNLREQLSNVFKAIVGALYLDQGEVAAREFLGRVFLGDLPELINNLCQLNPTVPLGIICTQRFKCSPQYHTIGNKPPKCVVRVTVPRAFSKEGRGETTALAKMDAARKALETLKALSG